MRSERTQREIDRLIESGWRIDEETPERTVLVRREYGDVVIHLLILVLTFWTGGIANVIYGAYKYLNSPKRVLRDENRECPSCGASVAAEADFCSNCGAEQPARERPSTTDCEECGAALAAGAKYCSSCGATAAKRGD